ncbi:hypothetical protein ACWDDN_02270 [Streptomyces griseoruber]
MVALSTAQAEAIEEAVQKARAARPDLDHHFTEGRLDEGRELERTYGTLRAQAHTPAESRALIEKLWGER